MDFRNLAIAVLIHSLTLLAAAGVSLLLDLRNTFFETVLEQLKERFVRPVDRCGQGGAVADNFRVQQKVDQLFRVRVHRC